MSAESFSIQGNHAIEAQPTVGVETESPTTVHSVKGEFEVPEGIKHVYDLFAGHLDGSVDLYSSVVILEERKRNVTDWVAHHVDRNRISFEEGLAVLIELKVIESQDI